MLPLAQALPSPITARQSGGGGKLVTLTDALSSNFTVKRTTLQWTSLGSDGSYVDQTASNDLVLANIVSGNSTTFVAAKDIGEQAREYYDYAIQGNA